MCAFMYMSSQVSAEHRVGRDLLRKFSVKPEFADILYHLDESDPETSKPSPVKIQRDEEGPRTEPERSQSTPARRSSGSHSSSTERPRHGRLGPRSGRSS